jgi:hypothetical protein
MPFYESDHCSDRDSLGLTKTGQGARIEAFYRSVPSMLVPGNALPHLSSCKDRILTLIYRGIGGCFD